MVQDLKDTHKKLSEIWQNDEIPVRDISGKDYAIFSDIHLGDGGKADDFRNNIKAMQAALDHYRKKEYELVLLGDIEEFWQFDLHAIVDKYKNSIYKRMKAFERGIIHRVYGNHDRVWGGLSDPAFEGPGAKGSAVRALKMGFGVDNPSILLVHGHQGSIESEKYQWFSRFWVRMFRSVEHIAKWLKLYGHGAATKSKIKKDYEKVMYSWAKKNKVMLICGHSHRAIFAAWSYVDRMKVKIRQLEGDILKNRDDRKLLRKKIKELGELQKQLDDEKSKNREITRLERYGDPLPCYFNAGCALYTNGITCIEIESGEIRLVKWTNEKRKDQSFNDTGDLKDYLQLIANSR